MENYMLGCIYEKGIEGMDIKLMVRTIKEQFNLESISLILVTGSFHEPNALEKRCVQIEGRNAVGGNWIYRFTCDDSANGMGKLWNTKPCVPADSRFDEYVAKLGLKGLKPNDAIFCYENPDIYRKRRYCIINDREIIVYRDPKITEV